MSRKWYGAPMPAPNPQRVRMFLAEKGVEIPEVTVNLLKGDHKKLGRRNPAQQLPFLELEDGNTIAESVSICRFIEEENPTCEPVLFGRNALQKATIDQWIRRVEFIFMMPLGMFWIHAHPFTKNLPRKRFPEFGQDSRDHLIKAIHWFDKQMTNNYLAGDEFTMADITLIASVDFANFVGVAIPDDCRNIAAWKARVDSRKSRL